MDKERRIIREIVSISRCLSFIRNVEFKHLDLTRGQHSFLTRIMENPGISQEELTFLLRGDKTTTAKALRKLENKGYINRVKSTSDKRSWNIYPEDKLVQIYPYLIQKIESTARDGLRGFSEEELETMLSYIQRMRENMDVEWGRLKQ